MNKPQLIRVDISTTMMLMCDTGYMNILSELSTHVEDHVSSITALDKDISVSIVTDRESIPKDWVNSYPYGDVKVDRKCSDIIAAIEESRNIKENLTKTDEQQDKFPFFFETNQNKYKVTMGV